MSRNVIVQLAGCLLLGAIVSLPAMAADDDDKAPKFKTKQIMKKAFKGPLLKKVAGGEASDEEKKQLHEMLVALSKNKQPRGEDESWKTLTSALVKAGEAAVKGDEKAGAMLKKAANCKACHKEHKPS
ncbi:hypothetical protein [Planctomycetes bacterium K23_9]|uniref:Cytochrome C n=1 Tax=Stieleria marina TaxID=1930275 RepID=A0A517NZ62_9BACT|nr:hypothetical protein K239x_44300 [Planctomycetes bacterium K23_9]